jgi:hypothetical protein
VETAWRLKASPDLWFQVLPDIDTRSIKLFVNGLLLEVDNDIAPEVIVVDRV